MEMDNETKGEGNSYTTHFRQLDPRIGRWLTIDPIFKDFQSPYVSMSNNPIWRIDPNGDDDFFDSNGNFLFSTNFGNEVRIVHDKAAFFNHVSTSHYILKDVSDQSEEMLTTMLRWDEYSTNIANYKFRTKKAATNIFSHYGKGILNEGEIIIATDRASLAPGLMTVTALNGNYAKDVYSDFIYGDKPQIYAQLIGRYTNTGSSIIKSYQIDNLLSSHANIQNVIVHEKFHLDNHVIRQNNGLYKYLGTEPSTGGDGAILRHLDAFDAQINHPTWEATTEDFKKSTARYIKGYINSIKDDDLKENLNRNYKEKLGDFYEE